MDSITVSEEVEAILRALTEPALLVQPDGKVLGAFTPMTEGTPEDYAAARAHFDPEEIRRRKESNGPYFTTEEVLRKLKSLEAGENRSASE
jgi:hypothetical protein